MQYLCFVGHFNEGKESNLLLICVWEPQYKATNVHHEVNIGDNCGPHSEDKTHNSSKVHYWISDIKIILLYSDH